MVSIAQLLAELRMFKLALKNLLRPDIMKMFVSAESVLLGRYDAATPAGGDLGADQLQAWLAQGGGQASPAVDAFLNREESKMAKNLHCFAA